MATAVVIGAGGGIGSALVGALAASGGYDTVYALSRAGTFSAEALSAGPHPGAVRLVPGTIDLGHPATIASAADAIGAPVELVIVATGLLHEGERGPERMLRELDADWLARQFAINTIGPALVLRHFAPLLPRRSRAAIALLSARVGSITDNRLGGWYGYRAAKAALNQMIRTAAHEIARSRPQALCVGLHPGTVATALSRPFQGGVDEGKLFAPAHAAAQLLAVLAGLTPADSGRVFAWDGSPIAP